MPGQLLVLEAELAAEDLHAEQGEDHHEEEEQEEERGDRLDRIEQRGNQIGQRAPVPDQQPPRRVLINAPYTQWTARGSPRTMVSADALPQATIHHAVD